MYQRGLRGNQVALLLFCDMNGTMWNAEVAGGRIWQ